MRKWIAGIWNSLAAWIFRKKLESCRHRHRASLSFPLPFVFGVLHEEAHRIGQQLLQDRILPL